MSRRPQLLALTILFLAHLLVIGGAFWLRAEVLSAWQKGPLVDPTAPYAPENALALSVVAGVLALDLYLGGLLFLRRRLGARPWIPALVMALSLGAAELGLRAWATYSQPSWFRPHPTLHWVVRPDLHNFRTGTGDTVITSNPDGLREARVERAKPADEIRILVLGDSSNFGQGVTGTEMWSAVLENLLGPIVAERTGRRLVVLNGATPGWTTDQGRRFLADVGGAYDPDLVLAGFNNDPGPEVESDRERAERSLLSPAAQGILFRSELYLIGRQGLLTTIRRFSPSARLSLARRKAGEEPVYGALAEERARALVPRVALAEAKDNLAAMKVQGEHQGFGLIWIDMPVNRLVPELVDRYVDWEYRRQIQTWAAENQVPLLDVDDRWARTRESNLHTPGHVFHPNAAGHRRLAEQVAAELIERGLIPGVPAFTPPFSVGGPTPAENPRRLRLGLSTLTPVHAHLYVVLQQKPQLAAKYGLDIELHGYERGGPQGEDVAKGKLDAWFTSGIPTVHMMRSRPDARIVAAPGVLGRVALLAPKGTPKENLQRVGYAGGTTAGLYWEDWFRGRQVAAVSLETDALLPALQAGQVDAIIGWDPWVADWQVQDPNLSVLASAPFQSALAVGSLWALGGPTGADPTPEAADPRARRLRTLVAEAFALARADRPTYDAAVSQLSGWSPEVVRRVADQNALLGPTAPPHAAVVLDDLGTLEQELDRAARTLGIEDSAHFFGPALLNGAPPPPGPQGAHPPTPSGKGPNAHPPSAPPVGNQPATRPNHPPGQPPGPGQPPHATPGQRPAPSPPPSPGGPR